MRTKMKENRSYKNTLLADLVLTIYAGAFGYAAQISGLVLTVGQTMRNLFVGLSHKFGARRAARTNGWRVGLSALAVFVCLNAAQSTNAATITVTALFDTVLADGNCTLREAITNANADNQSGSVDCAAGSGADTIDISIVGTINLFSALPDLTTDMNIVGLGAAQTTVRRTNSAPTEFRIFNKTGGTSAISGMTVRDGIIRGASANAGGIRNSIGSLTLTNVVVTNNRAIGGNGTNGAGGEATGGGIYSISELTVTGSTITGNSVVGGNGTTNGGIGLGGGIYISSAGTVTITNTIISENQATGGDGTTIGGAANGGGLYSVGTTNFILSSSVINNFALGGNSAQGNGGGVLVGGSTSILSVNNSIISGNTASTFGGGIINFNMVTINNSTLSNNTAAFGGAIRSSGTVNILGSTISANSATSGFTSGGVDTGGGGGTLNVTNSTISGNSANATSGANGGGFRSGGTTTLTNVTITDNSVANSGSASGILINNGTVNVKNTIIAANRNNAATPDVVGSSFTSDGYNLIGNVGAVTAFTQTGDQTGTNIAPLDPKLAPLGNYDGATLTHQLLPGSPAIDKGAAAVDPITNVPIITDQRGFVRPYDDPLIMNAADGSDIGAFEADRFLTVDTTSNDATLAACTAAADDCSLEGAIEVANNDNLTDTIVFNIPADSAGCNSTACTITSGSTLIAASDGGKLMTIDGGAASANTITLNGDLRQILSIGRNTNVSINNLMFTGGDDSSGGAIETSGTGSRLTLTNSALFGNTGGNGGALACVNGCALLMTNVTISGNFSEQGGGIYNNGTITATNCTITNNTVQFNGGGIILIGGTFNVRNTIIAGNSAPTGQDAIGTFNSLGNNLIGDTSNNNGFSTANGDILNPAGGAKLSPLGNYGGKSFTHALLDSGASPSPAINAGTFTGAPLTDARGASRVGNPDIGAFEVNSNYVAVLPDGKLAAYYNQTIAPDNGSFAYTVSSGMPPTGTTLQTGIPPSNFSDQTDKQTASEFAPQVARVSITGTPTVAGTYPFSISLNNGTNSTAINYSIFVPSAPTAASVSISGRVAGGGAGLTNATVLLTDQNGTVRSVRTSSFGYYRFDDVAVGETYVISVISRRYQFAPQVISVSDEIVNLDFTAN